MFSFHTTIAGAEAPGWFYIYSHSELMADKVFKSAFAECDRWQCHRSRSDVDRVVAKATWDGRDDGGAMAQLMTYRPCCSLPSMTMSPSS